MADATPEPESREAKVAAKKAKLAALRAKRAASAPTPDADSTGPPSDRGESTDNPSVTPQLTPSTSEGMLSPDNAPDPAPPRSSATEKRAKLRALQARRALKEKAAAEEAASGAEQQDEFEGLPTTRPRSLSMRSDGSRGSPTGSPRSGRRTVRDIAMLNTTIKNQKAKIQTLLSKDTEQQHRIETLEHELDAKGQELRAEKMRSTLEAKASSDTAAGNTAFQESEAEISRLHKHIEELAETHKADFAHAQEDADGLRQQADEAAAEVEAMRSQIEQLRLILMAQGAAALPADWFERLMARDGGANGGGDDGAGGEDATVVAEYEAALEEAYAELEELRSHKGRSNAESSYLSGTLDDYEQEILEQKNEMVRLQEKSANHDKEVSKYKRAAENNARKADELETRFDKSKVETERLKTEVSEMKKQLVDARAHVADSKQFSKHYTTEIDTAEAQIADLKAAKEDLEQRLVQEIEVSTAEAEKLSQELKVLEKRTATKQLELEHIKQTAIADIEAVKLELVDREQEVIEVRHEATLAAKQAADIEETMERVVSDLKSEVMSATGNMEGAALAGLGLQEMLEKMRGDHTAAVEALEGSLGTVTEERDGLSVELADVIEKLEMRNAQLTKVMAFLQTQQADADEGEEVGEDGESLGLGAMLERTKKSKEALEAQLTDYEDENGRLSKDLARTTRNYESTAASERKLQDALSALRREHTETVAELKETTALLDRVKGFMKSQSNKSAGVEHDEDEEEPDEGGGDFANFEQRVQQMLLQNRKLEQEVAKLESDLAREREARARLEQAGRHQQDEIDALNAKVLELANATAIGEKLREMLEEGESLRARLREEAEELHTTIAGLEAERDGLRGRLDAAVDELADLRKQLTTSITSADSTALAKLSLMELLEKLKEEHRAEIHGLESQIGALRAELDEKDATVIELLDLLPDRAETGTPLEQLRGRLDAVVRDKVLLTEKVEEYENQISQQTATIAKLRANVENLSSQVAKLKSTLKAREDDLDGMRSGVSQAVQTSHKMLTQFDGTNTAKPETEDLAAHAEQLKAIRATLARLTKELHNEEAKLCSKTTEHEAALATITELEQRITELKAEMQAAEEAAAKKLAKAKEEIASLRKRFADLTARYEEEGREKDDLLKKVQSQLEVAMSKGKDLSSRTNAKIHGLQDTITGLQDSLGEAQTTMKLLKEYLRKQALREWQTDDNVAECGGCNVDFSLFNRRHHCRICGQIYCSTCLKHKVMTTAKSKPVKSCLECFSYMGLLHVHETKSDALEAPEGKKLKKKEVVVTKIEKSGRFVGSLGFVVDITPEMPPLKGSIVIIKLVKKNGVAEGKLLAGDKIVSINGIAVAHSGEKKVLAALKTDSVDLIYLTPVLEGENDDEADAEEENFDYVLSPVKAGAPDSLSDDPAAEGVGKMAQLQGAEDDAASEEDTDDDLFLDDLDDGTISRMFLKNGIERGEVVEVGIESAESELIEVTITRPDLKSSFGFGIGTLEDGDTLISTVREGGIGENKVYLGDTLVALGEHSVEGLAHAEILQRMRLVTELILTVRRDPETNTGPKLEARRCGSINQLDLETGVTFAFRRDSVGRSVGPTRSPTPASSPNPSASPSRRPSSTSKAPSLDDVLDDNDEDLNTGSSAETKPATKSKVSSTGVSHPEELDAAREVATHNSNDPPSTLPSTLEEKGLSPESSTKRISKKVSSSGGKSTSSTKKSAPVSKASPTKEDHVARVTSPPSSQKGAASAKKVVIDAKTNGVPSPTPSDKDAARAKKEQTPKKGATATPATSPLPSEKKFTAPKVTSPKKETARASKAPPAATVDKGATKSPSGPGSAVQAAEPKATVKAKSPVKTSAKTPTSPVAKTPAVTKPKAVSSTPKRAIPAGLFDSDDDD